MSTDAQKLKALAAYSLLKANARADIVEAGVKLDALASAAVLIAESTADNLSVAVRSTLLEAAAQTGKFFFLFDLADVAQALETHRFDIVKLRRDEVAAVERAIRAFNKSRADTFIASDLTKKTAGKALADSVGTVTQLTRGVMKVRADVANALDTLATFFGKSRADTATVSDQRSNLVGKALASSAGTTDSFDRTAIFVREFLDSADATDEISVAAITDDGQVMYLDKALLDVATTGEIRTSAFSAARSDAFVTFEQALVGLSKPRLDAVAFGDSTTVEAGKLNTDVVAINETTTAAVATVRADMAATSEYAARSFVKLLADTVTTSDDLYRFFMKDRQDIVVHTDVADPVRIAANGVPPQIEAQTIADLYSPHLTKPFFETLRATDDFDGQTSTEDDQTTVFGKNISQFIFAMEQKTAALQKPRADTFAANDSGVLFWTNYCDSTYFSQGYVGQERTFT